MCIYIYHIYSSIHSSIDAWIASLFGSCEWCCEHGLTNISWSLCFFLLIFEYSKFYLGAVIVIREVMWVTLFCFLASWCQFNQLLRYTDGKQVGVYNSQASFQHLHKCSSGTARASCSGILLLTQGRVLWSAPPRPLGKPTPVVCYPGWTLESLEEILSDTIFMPHPEQKDSEIREIGPGTVVLGSPISDAPMELCLKTCDC